MHSLWGVAVPGMCHEARSDLCGITAGEAYGKPTREHLTKAKHALRYLTASRSYKLTLGAVGGVKAGSAMSATIYSNADIANCRVPAWCDWIHHVCWQLSCELGIPQAANRDEEYNGSGVCGWCVRHKQKMS
jgi:hypothetical protein